jgi:uncharacterized protein (TIGR00725 family)
LNLNKKIVTVFGSSKPDEGSEEYRTAYELGKLLAQAGYVICNGGYGGTMEASAHGAKDANGRTIGIVTNYFARIANPFIDQIIEEKSLIDRLLKLIEIGDAYIVLKGSTGTLLEFSMIWEFMNKSVMKQKPTFVLGNFWKPVIETLNTELAHEGLENVTRFITHLDNAEECVRLLKSSLK